MATAVFFWVARGRSRIKSVDIQSLTAGKVENVPCFCIKQILVDNGVPYCNNTVGIKTTNKTYFFPEF